MQLMKLNINLTDQYLDINLSRQRLVDEYYKYKGLVVAYDFDNTVYDFHKQGNTYHDVIKLLNELKEIGCTLIVWTANEDLSFVMQYLKDNNCPYDLINQNPAFFRSEYDPEPRKIYYNALLDDRAGLLQVYHELCNVVNIVKLNKQLKNE